MDINNILTIIDASNNPYIIQNYKFSYENNKPIY